METVLVILGALAIAGGVVVWHIYGARIMGWFKGGPITPQSPDLSGTVDKMHAARDEALAHAAVLEKQIATVRSDLTAATSKLVPPASSEVKS